MTTDPVGGVEMRRYEDPVEVRRGLVAGVEGPEQFLWRGRLWKVRDVVAHWVETGPWWLRDGVGADPVTARAEGESAAFGSEEGGRVGCVDLLAEREVWRVEAARGLAATGAGKGIFDLAFDWGQGTWQLTQCWD